MTDKLVCILSLGQRWKIKNEDLKGGSGGGGTIGFISFFRILFIHIALTW